MLPEVLEPARAAGLAAARTPLWRRGGAILLLTVSTPHASSEALPTSPDVARTPPGMAGPVVAWSLDDAATACKHEPRIVREHARKADGMGVWQGQLRGRGSWQCSHCRVVTGADQCTFFIVGLIQVLHLDSEHYSIRPKRQALLGTSGPARGPQRVSMRGGDGVPQPAAGADFWEFISFFARFLLVSWEFGELAAMLSRLATSFRRC